MCATPPAPGSPANEVSEVAITVWPFELAQGLAQPLVAADDASLGGVSAGKTLVSDLESALFSGS